MSKGKYGNRFLWVLFTAAVVLYLGLPCVAAEQAGANAGLRERSIRYYPDSPRVGQRVTFESLDFITQSIDWDFGDNTGIIQGGNRTTVHIFRTAGTFTVTAKDTSIGHAPAATSITVNPDLRSISVSPGAVRLGESVTVTANHFSSTFIDWDFGDGNSVSGTHTMTHTYAATGTFTITAREDCEDCPETFTAVVRVAGVDANVYLEIAEILLDNGNNYKAVKKLSPGNYALLRLKMSGSGTLAGYWMVDGQSFEYFEQWVNQGELKEIRTGTSPGLPVMDPGIHTVTVQLTKPENVQVSFPELKYYVSARELNVKTRKPRDGFVAKEDEITAFAWTPVKKAVSYQVAFSETLYPLISEDYQVTWHEVGAAVTFTPPAQLWNTFRRNRSTYWLVRALDARGKVLAQSEVRELKVVVAKGEIRIKKVTDLAEREIALLQGKRIQTQAAGILVHGEIDYTGQSDFMVLRVYVDDTLTDRLLFRDVKKNTPRSFETYLPHKNKNSRVVFQLLKTSSPAVIVGIDELRLTK
ncbi:MAG: PKD domain-containing protein [bacterium]|nr:PKD domain-containing protein [bacterium]